MGSDKGNERGTDQQDLFSELIQNSESKPFTRSTGEIRPPLTISVNMDKIIVFVLMFMMMFAVVFFCGIEAGKKMTRNHAGQSGDTVAQPAVDPTMRNASVQAVLPDAPAVNAVGVMPPVVETDKTPQPQVNEVAATSGSTETIQLPTEKVVAPIDDVADGSAVATTNAVTATDEGKEKLTDKVSGAIIWTIQAITYANKTYAQEEVKKLSGRGFSPFIIQSGKYMQICVGKFATRNEAEKVLDKLRRQKGYSDAYIRKVDQSKIQ